MFSNSKDSAEHCVGIGNQTIFLRHERQHIIFDPILALSSSSLLQTKQTHPTTNSYRQNRQLSNNTDNNPHSPSQVIWVCILCRKKQEIQSKTGQWFNRGEPTDPLGRTETQMGLLQQNPSDKRPKLERAQSAAEKENLPLQRTGSMLHRQYSQQEQPTSSRRMSSSEMGSGIPGGGGDALMMGPRRNPMPGGGPYGHYHHNQNQSGATNHQGLGHSQQQYGFQQYQSPQQQQQGMSLSRTQSGHYPDDDPSFYQVSGQEWRPFSGSVGFNI